MPLAPRLQRKRASRRRRAGRPPGRGSACSRRCRRGRRRDGRRPRARCRAGSVIGLAALRARPSSASRAARSAAIQAAGGRRSSFSSRAAQPGGQLGRVGAQDRRGAAARLVPAAVGVDDDLVGAARRQPGPQRLAGRHLAEAQDEVGDDRAGEALVAQQQVVGGDRRGSDREARSAAARSARRGSGSRQTRARWASGSRSSGSSWRPATITPAIASPMWPATSSSRKAEGSRSIRVTAVSGRAVAPFQRQRIGRGDRALDRERRQRLAPGKVEVDRPRPRLPARGGQRPAGDRAVVQQPVVVGLVGADFAEPAHRGAEELDLVDRLPGADPAQLRRPVGAEDDQRHRRFVGLADRRVVVRGGGAGGAEQRHRRRRSPAPPRARRTPPSARRGSPSPRSPAGARAPPPAASSGSRGRRPRGAVRRAPAPRRRRRRGRCWRWSDPRWQCRFSRPCGYKVANQAKGGGRRAPPRRSPRRGPGPAGGWSIPSRSSHSTDGDGRGEEALGGETVGQVGRRPARCRAGSGRPGRRRRSRPARRGRWRGRRGAPRRSRSLASGPPTLESLTPVIRAGADRSRPLGVGASLTLSSPATGSRSRPAARPVPSSVATGCSASSISNGSSAASVRFAVSTSQAALASTRIRASGPTASRTARTWPTSSPAPEL